MTGGDIAGLIAAGVFAVLVAFLALPLIKLGKVFDETTLAIRDASKGIAPILDETTQTIQQANKQLARVDTITGNVAEVTGNVNSLVALFAASVGGPLIKIAGFSAAVRTALVGVRGESPKGSGARGRRGKDASGVSSTTTKPVKPSTTSRRARKSSY